MKASCVILFVHFCVSCGYLSQNVFDTGNSQRPSRWPFWRCIYRSPSPLDWAMQPAGPSVRCRNITLLILWVMTSPQTDGVAGKTAWETTPPTRSRWLLNKDAHPARKSDGFRLSRLPDCHELNIGFIRAY